MSTLVYQPSPKMTTAATKETPLQARQRRAATECLGWLWTQAVEGSYEVMYCRTARHEKNPELASYRVTQFSCTCVDGCQGRRCKHQIAFGKEWQPFVRQMKAEAAAAVTPKFNCELCNDRGRMGSRWPCRCAAGQRIAQGHGRRITPAFCANCQEIGHTEADCPQPDRCPDPWDDAAGQARAQGRRGKAMVA